MSEAAAPLISFESKGYQSLRSLGTDGADGAVIS